MASARHTVHVEGPTRSLDGRTVIGGLRLHVQYGEFVALLGRGGCGRSTLLRVLAGLDSDISGTVLVPRRKAAVLQAPRSTPWRHVRRNALSGRAVAQEPELLLMTSPTPASPSRTDSSWNGWPPRRQDRWEDPAPSPRW